MADNNPNPQMVRVRRTYRLRNNIIVQTDNGHYHYRLATPEYADRVFGLDDSVPDNAVVHTGKSSNYYHPSHSLDDIPDVVVDAVVDRGFVVVGPVDAGWHRWEGRPEFSANYADFSDADVLAGDEQ